MRITPILQTPVAFAFVVRHTPEALGTAAILSGYSGTFPVPMAPPAYVLLTRIRLRRCRDYRTEPRLPRPELLSGWCSAGPQTRTRSMEQFRRYGLEHALRDVAVPEANCFWQLRLPCPCYQPSRALPRHPLFNWPRPLTLDYASRNGSGLKPRNF